MPHRTRTAQRSHVAEGVLDQGMARRSPVEIAALWGVTRPTRQGGPRENATARGTRPEAAREP
jgi:hypothetical protein